MRTRSPYCVLFVFIGEPTSCRSHNRSSGLLTRAESTACPPNSIRSRPGPDAVGLAWGGAGRGCGPGRRRVSSGWVGVVESREFWQRTGPRIQPLALVGIIYSCANSSHRSPPGRSPNHGSRLFCGNPSDAPARVALRHHSALGSTKALARRPAGSLALIAGSERAKLTRRPPPVLVPHLLRRPRESTHSTP